MDSEKQAGGNVQDVERIKIRNASMELEAADAEETYNAIRAFAADHEGYEAQRSLYSQDDQIRISARIRIPPEHLDALVTFCAEQAEVLQNNTQSEDITESYYDAQTRLRTMEAALERYYDFFQEADNIEEMLKVQSEIDRLTLNIEALKGQLALWDSLVAESELSLSIVQADAPLTDRRDIDWSTLSLSDMGTLIVNGLSWVGNAVVTGGQWLAIVLAVSSPLWITGGILVVVLRRRARKKKASKPDETSASDD